MTKNSIIEQVYTSSWLDDVIGKMHPEDLRDDLKQEAIMVLLEMDEQRLLEMQQSGMIKFFTIRIVINMIKSDRSKFFVMFRNYQELPVIPDKIEEDYTEVPEIPLDTIFDSTREDLYERDMLFHYCYSFDGNALAMARGTGIPYKTVIRTLINAKNRVKCYLKSLPE